MKFDDFAERLRVFESAGDRSVVPEMFMVARIDGRSFTRLTKESGDYEAPFDVRVRDAMVATTQHLMQCGFKVAYGYTQSDEISLLLRLDEAAFERKLRKYLSVLAGEASAAMSLALGKHAAFDCRISELPNADRVADYFRWRYEDAARNALGAHCYWGLRKAGRSPRAADSEVSALSWSAKHELLFGLGVNFNDLPAWQKRGCGLVWESFARESENPQTGEAVTTQRRRVRVELELPAREEYDAYVRARIAEAVGGAA